MWVAAIVEAYRSYLGLVNADSSSHPKPHARIRTALIDSSLMTSIIMRLPGPRPCRCRSPPVRDARVLGCGCCGKPRS
eukprot:4377223-Prymnesium_polylepis.1